MKIKEKIENNIYVVIISVVIFSIGATFSVLQFLYSQYKEKIILSYETKLEQCNSVLSSIKRGFSEENISIFEISDVFVNSNQKINTSNLNYFSEEEFYSMKDSSYWRHVVMPESYLIDEYANLKEQNSKEKLNYIKHPGNKIHMWIGNDCFILNKTSIYEDLGPLPVCPVVTFQKTNLDSVATLLPSSYVNENIENFEKIFKKYGLVNMILSLVEQQKTTALLHKNANFEIQDIQKQKDFFYISSVTTINNPVINGKELKKFYIQSEDIGLVRNNYVYIINLVNPTIDILNSNPEIINWLNYLKIIVK